VTPLIEALTEVEPIIAPVTRPTPWSVTTGGLPYVQMTEPEMLPVVPSVKVPVAVKTAPIPTGIEKLSGVTVMPVRAAGVTVTGAAGEDTPFE